MVEIAGCWCLEAVEIKFIQQGQLLDGPELHSMAYPVFRVEKMIEFSFPFLEFFIHPRLAFFIMTTIFE